VNLLSSAESAAEPAEAQGHPLTGDEPNPLPSAESVAEGNPLTGDGVTGDGVTGDGVTGDDRRTHPALPSGVSEEWWMSVQALIQADMQPTSATNAAALPPGFSANGEAPGNFFGDVATSAGDVNGDGFADVAVGAFGVNSNTGKVYVFHGGPNGLSGTAASPAFSASGEATGDSFGVAIAAGDVNGDGYDDLAIGASGVNTLTGKVYVFHGGPGGLSGSATNPAFSASGKTIGGYFGISIASADDVNGDGFADIAVGAPGGLNILGEVYLFHGGPGGLIGSIANPAFSASGEAVGSRFGSAVAGAGDVNGDGFADLAVGADGASNDSGKLYLFHGGLGGLSGSTASPAFSANGQNQGDQFGISLAGAGDVNGDGFADLAVGASGAISGSGKLYLFHGGPAGLAGSAANPAFSANGEAPGNAFGFAVAGVSDVNGDGYADVAAGAPGHNANAGKLYLFVGGTSGLSGSAASPVFSVDGATSGERLGWAVAGAGDVNGDGLDDLIAGALGASNNTGRVALFHGAPGSLGGSATNPAFSASGEGQNHFFGASMAGAGDVNGDGYADVVVGAYGVNNNSGRIYLFHGGANGLSGSTANPAFSANGETANSFFGFAVAGAGDVNGDGYADVAVGADGFSGDTGKVYIFHGGPGGLSGSAATPGFAIVGETTTTFFGRSLTGAGDVNGDGFADLAVGAFGFDGYTGKVYIFHGGPAGLNGTASSPAFNVTGEAQNGFFGFAVTRAGDVNGDGYADVAVGADGVNNYAGKLYLFHGGPGGLTGSAASPAFSANGEGAGHYFANALAGAGDVNGDGYADLAVGAYAVENNTGRLYLFHGGSGGLSGSAASAQFRTSGPAINSYFAASVAGAGDVNGDGYADVAVGANGTETFTGRLYLFHGGPAGLSGSTTNPAFSTDGVIAAGSFGRALAGAGDVNGDGFADLAVGASGVISNSGKLYLLHGGAAKAESGGSGRPVRANQLRVDGSNRWVAPWGFSNGDGVLAVSINATSPSGRARVKLQVQACPTGIPFGHATCKERISATWVDVTASSAGVTLHETLSELSGSELQHWRVRVLRAPFNVTQPGITAPPLPNHGPWRRLNGQAVEADVRVGAILRADVALSKTVTAGPVAPGQSIVYTLTFHNDGPDRAIDMALFDSPPAGLVVTGVSSSTVGADVQIVQKSGAPNFRWAVNSLPAGAGGAILLAARVTSTLNSDVVIDNLATLTATNDISSSDNSASAQLSVIAPRVGFATAAFNGSERAGSAPITITLNAANPYADVRVRLANVGGSATPGDDYAALNQPVTIPAGQQQVTAQVTLIDDDASEGSEMVVLTLSEPLGAALGALSTATLTIADDGVGGATKKLYLPVVVK
jgi:uncharacterized repeat protein (TIGR01451 family)